MNKKQITKAMHHAALAFADMPDMAETTYQLASGDWITISLDDGILYASLGRSDTIVASLKMPRVEWEASYETP